MAKTLIYEQSHHATFPGTINRLTTNRALDNKYALLFKSPFMNGNLIRARGQLRHSPMQLRTLLFYTERKLSFYL